MFHRIHAPVALAAACLFVACGAQAAKAIRFHITDLGPVTEAEGVNSHGLVVGWANGHAAVFDGAGGITDLGTLGGTSSAARGVNDSKKIVGGAATATSYSHAFLYSTNTHQMVDLGTLSKSPTAASSAGAINKSGQIVGSADADNFETHAFIYQHGEMTDLGTLPGYAVTALSGINTAGHAVGYAQGIDSQHAVLYRDGQLTDLGTTGVPGESCLAFAINDADQIVGRCGTLWPSFGPAFLYENGQMKSIGVARPTDASSTAVAINNHGVVVGFSQPFGSDLPVAFVYNGKVAVDLNTLVDDSGTGLWLRSADGINDKDEIVGLGILNGEFHGFVAVPVKP